MPNSRGKLREATSFVTSDPKCATKINQEREGAASQDPISVPALMARTVRDYGDHPALMYKTDDASKGWQKITYREYKERVDQMAKAFIKLGLERHHTVAVLAFNSPEWFVTELAAIHAG